MKPLTIEGRARKDILDAAYRAGKTGAHIAPFLSLVELTLAVLKNLKKGKDSFVLSKGHGALGYYAVMHQLGMISDGQFASFEKDGGEFPGQPCRSEQNGIAYSGGSLGMGLSYGVGLAQAKKQKKTGGKVYVVLGDGELNEGSVWEAAALASRLKLGNLTALIDRNGLQSDGRCEEISGMDPERMWGACGWKTIRCDGHSTDGLEAALADMEEDVPLAILAETVKGKGVSFMEHNNEWHHQVLSEEAHRRAIKEIGDRYELCEE